MRLLLLTLLAATAACGQQNEAPPASTANSLGSTQQSNATEWQTTPSGIRYRRISGAGTGPKPSQTDTVTIHYVGKLMDGTEFDSSFRAGEPVTMALPSLIPGWREGVPLMSVGDIYEFVIPPELGYGASEAGPIPANSTLHFTIGLIGIGGQG
ncbi:FKBP-type peptidyl-prolyl cis-trans isomerase [Sphingosinicella sp. YJ22]|uniref:FKBP-type peptidyl-prolyl cis-trans isomerase n=1 Tax=Sphingosinicella sp. YJ22 TaxID=1104780 RepID=UPI001407B444|nr:FKBP-type peptidyl-prolyl cis-trans isomerase [Sphingosinicella sp. YJ22]